MAEGEEVGSYSVRDRPTPGWSTSGLAAMHCALGSNVGYSYICGIPCGVGYNVMRSVRDTVRCGIRCRRQHWSCHTHARIRCNRFTTAHSPVNECADRCECSAVAVDAFIGAFASEPRAAWAVGEVRDCGCASAPPGINHSRTPFVSVVLARSCTALCGRGCRSPSSRRHTAEHPSIRWC